MALRFKLVISYDGTHYLGWQKTRMGPSIQEKIEHAIHRITGEKVTPEAASRTDRGVHAEGQSIHFDLEKEITASQLQRSLNGVLPPDIRIIQSEIASPEFHATLDAKGKTYHYRLSPGFVQDPIDRLYAWHVPRPLNLEIMKQASADLIGEKDFSALANESSENPVCTVREIQIVQIEGGKLQIAIEGNRFLYKMARNIVGTLVYIGCGKLPPGCIPELLVSKDRKKAGITAPAHGLYLHQVFYR